MGMVKYGEWLNVYKSIRVYHLGIWDGNLQYVKF